MHLKSILLTLASVLTVAAPAFAADKSGNDEPAFRTLYKELVETNTAQGVGSCTLAAQRMEARLKAAGYTDADLHLFIPESAPNDGGLVAVLKGSGSKQKAVLLLAHIDVVAAKREDWTRDPFTLIEEGGYFYGRGTSDDKAQAAIWTDLLIRYKQEGYKPKRDIKIALTCGEETEGVFNGAQWLSTEHKDWIDAAFALNEGANGQLDDQGRKVALNIEAAEKVYQDFKLETTNPGGHSSRPVPDNAIYEMSAALPKIGAYEFPVMLNDATKAYFSRMAPITGGENGTAMLAILKNPQDEAANAILSKNPQWHSMLRTTCVATMIEGGHALNALPQHVAANVNCRIFPDVSVDDVQGALVKAIDDPNVKVSVVEPRSLATPAPALNAAFLAPIEKVSGEMWPGVPVIPTMTTGATDGVYTSAAGIPTYGVEGLFVDPDEGHIHGLNERVGVTSLMDARRFMYRLVKIYGNQ